MENIKLSVVTPCMNSEKTLRATIESVLNQTYNNYEYIIIDGGSKDNTLTIIESYRRAFAAKNIKFTVVSEKDFGIYDAMNKGIKLVAGDFVGIVNSDDFYELDALANVNSFYLENKFDIMFADLRIFDEKGSFVKTAKLNKKFQKRHWNHPTMFVSKLIYNERLYASATLFDDLDFILWAINQKKYKILTLDKVISNFQRGGISGTKKWSKSMERVKLANKIFKQNNMKGYKLENFLTEVAKFIL